MSGALVLRGEAGVGKTALLKSTVGEAAGFSVIQIEGIESEMPLGYAALHRLLRPYMDRVERLPEPQRLALHSAFGLASRAPADRFLVSLAALTVLCDVACDAPLLVVVDDAQWLDYESVAALVFVARRLDADRIALIFAVRDTLDLVATFQGIPALHMHGLDEHFAIDLLATSVSVPVSYGVAKRITAATRGNPLALVELSGELTSAHLADQAPLPDPLPIGDLIQARFLRQVSQLPDDAQLLLLVAAAESAGDPDTLRRAADVLGLSSVAVERALDSGLLLIEPRIEFRHPLVRSAVYAGADAEHRRRVHRALAAVADVEQDADRRAMHMAAVALGPDEDLAAALERSAIQARARGGYIAESSFLVRAASLTPDPQAKAGRLLAAALAAFFAGNAAYSDSLLREALPDLTDPIERAQAQRLDGRLRLPLGQPQLGPALLLGAAKAFEPIDRRLCHQSLLDALQSSEASMHFTEGTTISEIAATALVSLRQQTTPAAPADIMLKGVAMRYGGSYLDAVPAMRDAVDIQSAMSFEELNRWTMLGPELAHDLWDEVKLRAMLERLEHAARVQGSLSALQVALLSLAAVEIRSGRFLAARERYAELHDVTLTINGTLEVYDLLDIELLAWQGDERTRTKAAELEAGGNAFCTGSIIVLGNLALSTFELGVGQYEKALAAARFVVDADSMGWSGQALAAVVEAAVRCGDDEACASALAQLTDRAEASGTPWALGLLERCRALTAEPPSAEFHYREALGWFARTALLAEVARTHLVYGEWLRRQKRRSEAREQLSQAYEMFDAMGARAFAERARVELLATGQRARARRPDTAYDLTSRELQIARLASQRATSREIASQLFISTNTVDYHLRKVFQKLGISSRRELAELLKEETGSRM